MVIGTHLTWNRFLYTHFYLKYEVNSAVIAVTKLLMDLRKKAKLLLCLINQNTVKIYGGMEV